jgi:hypothetical protein
VPTPTPVTPTPVTPTPSLSPVPSPTQTVIVNLPHEGGLPQSYATIIAACIAVLAALIALGGVWWQIRAAARQASRQIRAAATEARNDRATNARLGRQDHLVERMAEGLTLTRSLQDLLRGKGAPLREWGETNKNAFNEQTERARTLVSMLVVLGAVKSGQALWKLTYLLNIIANQQPTDRGGSKLDGKSAMQLRSEMTIAFQDDLSVETDSESAGAGQTESAGAGAGSGEEPTAPDQPIPPAPPGPTTAAG